MFSKQRNNYVLDERPSTAATSTPLAPADDGKFCLETPTSNIHTIFTVTTSIVVCNRNMAAAAMHVYPRNK